MSQDSISLLNAAAQAIFDKKGFNILALDIKNISTLTDYVLIAEGNVDKHVVAIAQAVASELERQGVSPCYVEGLKSGDWVVLDYMHIMIHLFMPGIREMYQLEQLWQKGTIVDLQIDVSSAKK